jgi:predicted transcriptional regulator
MTVKEALHQIIDEMPQVQADRLLETLEDPVARSLALAPIDDEPETEEEKAAVAEGIAALERGEFVTTEELRRELGL